MVFTLGPIGGRTFNWYSREMLLYGIGAIALGVAVVNAYLNDGLLVSTAITFAFALGYGFGTVILYSIGAPAGDSPPEFLFVYYAVLSIGLGVVAFAVGVGIRRIVPSGIM